jgi:hypothetical protein
MLSAELPDSLLHPAPEAADTAIEEEGKVNTTNTVKRNFKYFI